jgi:tRNA-dihydrouridine synthase
LVFLNKNKTMNLHSCISSDKGFVIGLAPMFEINDLAFRILCRNYGVKLCWTGMINVHNWASQSHSRSKLFNTCDIDRPLIIQLCGNDENKLIACAKDLEQYAIAIDMNFGCTQHVAKKGQYGYFMVNSEGKRQNAIELVKSMKKSLNIPITAKFRIIDGADGQPDVELTKNFAIELEKAGVALISVHGRRKNSNKEGPVDAEAIKAIAEAVGVPVFANGGVETMEEGIKLIEESKAHGLMVGQGLLKNPKAFSDDPVPDPVGIGREYIDLFKKYPDQNFYIARRHIFNFFAMHISKESTKIADFLKTTQTIEDLEKFLDDFEAGKYTTNE